MKSPHHSIFPLVQQDYDDDVPFGRAMPLILPVPLRSIYIDGFVDDGMTIVVDDDDENKIERAAIANGTSCNVSTHKHRGASTTTQYS